jgi:hypothetical protein
VWINRLSWDGLSWRCGWLTRGGRFLLLFSSKLGLKVFGVFFSVALLEPLFVRPHPATGGRD